MEVDGQKGFPEVVGDQPPGRKVYLVTAMLKAVQGVPKLSDIYIWLLFLNLEGLLWLI